MLTYREGWLITKKTEFININTILYKAEQGSAYQREQPDLDPLKENSQICILSENSQIWILSKVNSQICIIPNRPAKFRSYQREQPDLDHIKENSHICHIWIL
jgi:hypothetical protein